MSHVSCDSRLCSLTIETLSDRQTLRHGRISIYLKKYKGLFSTKTCNLRTLKVSTWLTSVNGIGHAHI